MAESSPSGADVVHELKLSKAQRRACPTVGAFTGQRCELLAQVCYPLSPEHFMARNWQRCAFAVHGPAARYEALSQVSHAGGLNSALAVICGDFFFELCS
eukprot:5392848-Pleurochrysis_carterae.AAC.4